MGFRTNAILIEPAWEGSEQELLAVLGVTARPATEEPLADAWHPAHLSVGRLGACTIVLDHLLVDLLVHREVELEHQLATILADRRVLAVHVDDDLCSYAWVLWEGGERRRARLGSARDGIRIDEGTWLPEERRWPVLVERGGLRWVDERGRTFNHTRMGLRCVRWLTERLLGHPIDRHPELEAATVVRFVEPSMPRTELGTSSNSSSDGEARDEEAREPLPRWLRRLLGR